MILFLKIHELSWREGLNLHSRGLRPRAFTVRPRQDSCIPGSKWQETGLNRRCSRHECDGCAALPSCRGYGCGMTRTSTSQFRILISFSFDDAPAFMEKKKEILLEGPRSLILR